MNREIKFRGKSLVDIGNIKKGDLVYRDIEILQELIEESE